MTNADIIKEKIMLHGFTMCFMSVIQKLDGQFMTNYKVVQISIGVMILGCCAR